MDPESYFGRIFGAEGSKDAKMALFLGVIVGAGIAMSGVLRYLKIASS